MDIIVVGLGEVGKYITSVLVGEGNNVTVVDRAPAALAAVEESMDVLAWRGNGASLRALEETRAAQADLVISTSARMKANTRVYNGRAWRSARHCTRIKPGTHAQ